MSIYADKTKIKVIGKEGIISNINLDGREIEEMETFTY